MAAARPDRSPSNATLERPLAFRSGRPSITASHSSSAAIASRSLSSIPTAGTSANSCRAVSRQAGRLTGRGSTTHRWMTTKDGASRRCRREVGRRWSFARTPTCMRRRPGAPRCITRRAPPAGGRMGLGVPARQPRGRTAPGAHLCARHADAGVEALREHVALARRALSRAPDDRRRHREHRSDAGRRRHVHTGHRLRRSRDAHRPPGVVGARRRNRSMPPSPM